VCCRYPKEQSGHTCALSLFDIVHAATGTLFLGFPPDVCRIILRQFFREYLLFFFMDECKNLVHPGKTVGLFVLMVIYLRKCGAPNVSRGIPSSP
jgi:hypothetical protein